MKNRFIAHTLKSVFVTLLVIFCTEAMYSQCEGTAIAQEGGTTCSSSGHLFASPPTEGYTGFWETNDNSIVIEHSTNNITKVFGLDYGDNEFTWTVTNGICSDTDISTIKNKEAYAEIVEENMTTCKNSAIIHISCTENSEISLDFQYGGYNSQIINLGDNAYELNNLEPNWNMLLLEARNDICVDYDTYSIFVDQVPQQALAIESFSTCTETVQLQAPKPSRYNATGVWKTLGAGSSTLIEETTSYNSFVHDLGPDINTFCWVVTSDLYGCKDSAEINIDNRSVDAGMGFADIIVCSESAIISAIRPDINETGYWEILSAGEDTYISNSNDYHTTVEELAIGHNAVRWTIEDQYCSDSETVNVYNYDIPSEFLNPVYDEIVCSNSVEVSMPDFFQYGGGYEGAWSSLGNHPNLRIYSSTSNTTIISGLSFGVNVFTWTVSSYGCVAQSFVVVRNYSVAAYTYGDETICSDNTMLRGSGLEPYGKWEILQAGESTYIENTAHAYTPVYNLANGENKFRWTVSNEYCSDADICDITYWHIPSGAGSIEDESVATCAFSVDLLAQNPQDFAPYLSGSWSVQSPFPADIDNSNSHITQARNILPGTTNVFQWTVSNHGCTQTDEFIVENNAPDLRTYGNEVTCHDFFQLKANDLKDDESGYWDVLSSSGDVYFGQSDAPSTMVYNLTPGENSFQWVVSNSTCSASETIHVKSYVIPEGLLAIEDETICSNSAMLSAPDPSEYDYLSGQWRVLGTDLVTIEHPYAHETEINNLQYGHNEFQWSIGNAYCAESVEIIILNGKPEINAGPDQIIYTSNTHLEASTVSTGPGIWNYDTQTNTVQFSNIESPSSFVSDLNEGENRFIWTISGHTECPAQKDTVNIFSYQNLPADWQYSSTGGTHAIVLNPEDPIRSLVRFNGNEIQNGDLIGVFYQNEQESLSCAGYGPWSDKGATISAHGATPGIDNGFETGDEFHFKIYRASNSDVFDVNADYKIINDYTDIRYAEQGKTAVELLYTEKDLQGIQFSQGWNMFSTYIIPFNNQCSDVLIRGGVKEQVVLVKDETGLAYYPQLGFGILQTFQIGEGYKMKLEEDTELSVIGKASIPGEVAIDLRIGWNILGYLHQSSGNIVDMLSPILNSVVLIKDETGAAYYPALGFGTLNIMNPGKGYQIKMVVGESFSYPESMKSGKIKHEIHEQPQFFASPVNTGSNMTVIIPDYAWDEIPQVGDELAAFSTDGKLIGSIVLSSSHNILPVFGDDITTRQSDGLAHGEGFSFQYWNKLSGNISTLHISNWEKGGNTFENDAIAVAGKVAQTSLGIQNQDSKKQLSIHFYPNPVYNNAYIEFYADQTNPVSVEIYNAFGQLVQTVMSNTIYTRGKHEVTYNCESLKPGMYNCKISIGTESVNIKFLKM